METTYKFERTDADYPEQYNIYDDSHQQVGYMRLRYGELSLRTPNAMGKPIFFDNSKELGNVGEFKDETIRKKYIKICDKALRVYFEKHRR